jgi:hypothetical protein
LGSVLCRSPDKVTDDNRMGFLGKNLSLPSDRMPTLRTRLEPLAYRVATFFVLSILDDPAMLAMAFC